MLQFREEAVRPVTIRHSARGILPRLALALLLPATAAAANLALQISTEQAPPGGWAQFKVTAVTPSLVAAGMIAMSFDPTVFGPVSEVSVFSATGDAMAYANINGQQLTVNFSSASAGIAQLNGLPVLTVSLPVLASAAPGATANITLDPTGSTWTDNLGNPYTVSVTPATFTVRGTVSVETITPGGGFVS